MQVSAVEVYRRVREFAVTGTTPDRAWRQSWVLFGNRGPAWDFLVRAQWLRGCDGQRLLDFPGLLPNPPLHVAGRSAKIVLQFHLG